MNIKNFKASNEHFEVVIFYIAIAILIRFKMMMSIKKAYDMALIVDNILAFKLDNT